jgi:hypothetical protein
MSTIRVTNVQDTSGGNSSTTAEIKNGIAKAWVNFNGSGTVAILAQYNVSSITDNGTGDYTVNFTNALVDANYAMTQSARGTSDGGYPVIAKERTATTKTNSLIRIYTQGQSSDFGLVDSPVVCIGIFR